MRHQLPLLAAMICFSSAEIAGAQPSGSDIDADYIDDGIEDALAARFFPQMNMHCGTYEGVDYGSQGQFYGTDVGFAVNGKLPFVAHIYVDDRLTPCNVSGHCIEIRYGMAYNWDLGDDGDLDFLAGGADAHPGDSEIYSVLLATDADWNTANLETDVWWVWKTYGSAHSCGTGDSSSFQTVNSYDPPTDWIAEGKNGNYTSQDACNSGGTLGNDDCSDNRCWINRDYAVSKLMNAGEYVNPNIGVGAGHVPNARPTDGYKGFSDQVTIPAPANEPNGAPHDNYVIWGNQPFGQAGAFCKHLSRYLDWATEQQDCGDAHPDCK